MKRYIRSNIIDNVYSYDKVVLSGNHLTPAELSKTLSSEIEDDDNLIEVRAVYNAKHDETTIWYKYTDSSARDTYNNFYNDMNGIKSSTERKFYDTEHDEVITLSQLKEEYEELSANGETEAETFKDYLSNCLDKNGTLEEI